PTSVPAATGALVETLEPVAVAVTDPLADESGPDGPGQIVRQKEHTAKPMTIDQALFEMELVGHDFFLFADADGGCPSVVYRRKGYDYGVIRLVD
ncbi:MAG: sigma 54 modulation/S30EA ribosomal C-terminal domain-containing protein, partial [Actinomycetota bacterium]|nr:sigma 54 modulation/S30EA ribosomal C-terminal domain-containing protein [Actinomycetota bacterium]